MTGSADLDGETGRTSGVRTNLRRRLAEDRPLIALFSIIPAVEIVELAALAGFGAVILDTEHGSHGSEALPSLILAAQARGTYSIVRVRHNHPSLIGAALDAGADGVLIPQIASTEEALQACAAARFAPQGSRGANPWVRAADFGTGPEWFARANEETAVILMVEGAAGLANFDAIAAVEGIDGIFVGPVDLSHSLGVPGQVDHPSVRRAAGDIIRRSTQAGIAPGVFTPTARGAREWIAAGARLVAVGVDTGHVKAAFRQIVSDAGGTAP